MLEPTMHRRVLRVVSGPISSPFSDANIAACNQAEIAFLEIAGGHEAEIIMALPHL